MDKWLLANNLLHTLEKEIDREGINDDYFRALRDTIDSLNTLIKFWL